MKHLKIIALTIIAIMAVLVIGAMGLETAIGIFAGSGYCFAGAMTLLEITDEKTQLLDANDEIFEKVKAEKRSMSDAEKKKVQDNNLRMRELELIEESMSFKDEKGRQVRNDHQSIPVPKERFSLLRTIREFVDNKQISEAARNINVLGQMEFRKAEVSAKGHILIPSVAPAELRADIVAQGAEGTGIEIIATEKKAILPPLENKLVLAKAGATYMPGLTGNVSIPSYSGTTVLWKGETIAADDGAGEFGDVELSPKRLTAYLDVSKLFLAQDSVGAERLLLDNLASAVARKLESTVLGVAAGSATQPQGMGYAITSGTDTQTAKVVPSWTALVGMESLIDASNALVDKLAYITNAAGRGILKSLPKGSSSDDIMLCENNQVNGYPLLVTNGCSGAAGTDAGQLLVFGNWQELVIGSWGGLDITIDPFTLSVSGKVRLVINAYFDAKGLRGTSPTDVHGAVTTQPNDYAVAFTTMAMKLS